MEFIINRKILFLYLPQYLRGQVQDDMDRSIIVNDEVEEKLKIVYSQRNYSLYLENMMLIIELLKKGLIDFMNRRRILQGINNKIIELAKERGEFINQPYVDKGRVIQEINL